MRCAARHAILLLGAAALSACGGGYGKRSDRGPHYRQVAQSGEVVAAELAFARAVKDKGQRAAFLEYAADDAVMFVPRPVKAKDWLKGNDLPGSPRSWQPHQVWSSCDGSLAVTGGAWQGADGSFGSYTTIWQRQEDGSYRWVIDEGETLEEPVGEPQMVQAEVAECDPKPMISAVDPAADGPGGASQDRTLSWVMRLGPDGSRNLTLRLWNGSEGEEVLSKTYAGPAS